MSESLSLPVIGWREVILLPSFQNSFIEVKVDTGAKTSALHAENIEFFEQNHEQWVRFILHPERMSKNPEIIVESKVLEMRTITSSNGHSQERPVILTNYQLGGCTFPLEITLVNRDIMGYRMLLGRQAIRKKFLVHSGATYLLSQKPNQGRVQNESGVDE